MIEADYTAAVHKRLPPNVYHWKINDNYAGGVPDAFYRRLDGPGQPLWAEYKFLKTLPKRDTTLVVPDLTSQQLHWLRQALVAGEQAIVVIGVEQEKVNRGSAGFILLPDEWGPGITAGEARSRLLGYADLAKVIYSYIARIQ